MRQYETTFIVNPQTDDATIDAQVKAITDIITKAGGKIVYENLMGTRRMAYPIKKLSQGYYANFIFDAPKTVVAEIDLHIRMNEAYLRHLTILYEGQIPDPDAPPSDDYRGFGRPRGGGRYERPYGGRREGGQDGYRDRGRPGPASRRPESTESKEGAPAAEATDKPAPETTVEKPATPAPVVASETTPEAPAAATPAPTPEPTVAPTPTPEPEPAPEPAKAVEPEPTPEPTATEPEPPTPSPAAPPPKPTETEDYREEEEL